MLDDRVRPTPADEDERPPPLDERGEPPLVGRPEPRPALEDRSSRWGSSVLTLSSSFTVMHGRGHPGTRAHKALMAAHPEVDGHQQKMSGGDLLSHAASRAVPSALKSLASGFGMEPGVSSSP